MNELQAELGPKGFTVVGVSNEASGLLESHIEKKGIAYPIAKVKGENADRIYGVKGFPSGALVDANGRVIWTGHPGSVSKADIVNALEGASFLAPIEGDDYKKLNKLMAEREFGKALSDIEKDLTKSPEDEGLKSAKAAIEGLLESRQALAVAATASADFGKAMEIYSEIEEFFSGHEASKAAKESAKLLDKNPDAKDELAAWKKMVKGDEAQIEGDFEKAAKIYAGIAKKYPDTKSGKLAEAFVNRHGF